MPIFDFNEFGYRNALKLAPDALVSFNGALGAKVVSPLKEGKNQNIDVQGGITSININAATVTASGRANITVVAPKYKGLHEDYYVTLPSGVRLPFFLPMMEVKVYMKGRYFGVANKPVYYPVFWGFITNVSEDYSDGTTTFSLTCWDVLGWWKYQKLTLNPSWAGVLFRGPVPEHFPTIFENKNPWQIIMHLIRDTSWMSKDDTATYNFVAPSLSNSFIPPDLGGVPPGVIGALATKLTEYWADRFTFSGEQLPLEMFGLTGQLSTQDLKTLERLTLNGTDLRTNKYNEEAPVDVKLDYNILARVQPYGDIDLFGVGAQPVTKTKLEIAQEVCDMVHMEFYLDMNGILVFKPPFYNMDVTKSDINHYIVNASDVISFNASLDSDQIVTYLEVNAPQTQTYKQIDLTGFHIDWDLMTRYGMRYQKGYVTYGNDSNSLRLIAAAELSKINGRATTGSVTIPLRPEMRLGYPVYIEHKDEFYYVSGISHSFAFGANATTDLSLEMRRERLYDSTGEITKNRPVQGKISVDRTADESNVGRVLKGYVWRYRSLTEAQVESIFSSTEDLSVEKRVAEQTKFNDQAYLKTLTEKEKYKYLTEVVAGPRFNGLYEISPARLVSSSLEQGSAVHNSTGERSTVVSNELLMITNDTIPYTDANGYRHIGAFPYGANLRLKNGIDIENLNTLEDEIFNRTEKLIKDELMNSNTTDPKPLPENPFNPIPENSREEQKKSDNIINDMIADPFVGDVA